MKWLLWLFLIGTALAQTTVAPNTTMFSPVTLLSSNGVFAPTIIGNCHTEANASTAVINLTGTPTTGCPTTATAGDLIVAGVKAGSGVSITSTGPTCNNGRGWEPGLTGGASLVNSAGFQSNYWYCLVDSTATMTITGHSGGSYTDVKIVDARSNLGWDPYPLDRSITNIQSTATTAFSAGTTPTMNNPSDFIVAIEDNWNATQTYGAVSTWNFLSNTSGAEYAMWWKSLSTQGTTSFSGTGVSDSFNGAQIGFMGQRSDSCDRYVLWDFSGGTNGSNPTAATLKSSLFGWPNESPQSFINVTGTALKYSTSGHHALAGSAPNFCAGGAYTDSGSLGMVYDTTTGGLSTIVFHFNNYAGGTNDAGGNIANTVTATMWFCTTLPQTATVNMDLFAIYASNGQFINIPFQGAGTALSMIIEAGSGSAAVPIATSASCGPSTGTWYQLAIEYVKNGTGQFQVFDASGTQVGSTWTVTLPNSDAAQLVIGNNLANSPTSGFGVYFDKIKLCFQGTCTYPLME